VWNFGDLVKEYAFHLPIPNHGSPKQYFTLTNLSARTVIEFKSQCVEQETAMKKLTLFALLFIPSFLPIATQAEEPPIRWVVKDGQNVNRPQGERLYLEAVRWIEDRYESPVPLRPHLTIRVGERCPDTKITGACMGPWPGDLYLPEWDEAAPGYIVQATLKASLQQLLSNEDVRQVTVDLLTEDVSNFLDARR
jgi:hypothetical protein